MPSMFSRRRGSVNQISSAPPTTSAAAIAASSAFLKNSASTTSLSSAAAAAALRSHTTSPEPIANIQTKRMQRRGSVSSIGSGSIMSARAGMTSPRPGMAMMERRGSQSSMTERTFRSPSPANTPSSRKARAVPAAADAPPLPKNTGPGRRSASVEPSVQRVTSPTPRAGRGASVDRFAGRVASLPQLPEHQLERKGSVNFSRPISPPPASPTTVPSIKKAPGSRVTSPPQTNGSPRTNGSARPHSSLGFTRNEVSGIQSDLRNVADKPVAKKKKTVVAKEGEQPAAGTMVRGPTGAAVNGTASRPMSPLVVNRNATASPGPSATAANGASSRPMSPPVVNRNAAASPAPSVNTTPTTKKKKPTAATVDAAVQPPPKNPARALSPTPVKSALNKKPSVVREDPEAEQNAESRTPRARPASAAGMRQTPETYARNVNRPASAAGMRSSSMMTTSTGPALSYLAPDSPRVRASSLEVPRAHFSKDIVDANGVRHAPPPRSSSPFKSALKHSPSSSIRTNSPAAYNTSPRPPLSETSDTTSITSQDGVKPGKKKKNVRVSFDGDVAGAGQETQRPPQPVAFSPRRSLSPAFNDENDDMMQPRPALPTFGSVRSASSPARSQTASSPATTKTALPANGSASNDHAVGAVLANDHSTKKASMQDTDAPLPSQVTSVDGSGYDSEASHYSEDEESAAAATPAAVVPETTTVTPSATESVTTSATAPTATSTTTSTDTASQPIVADIMIPDISVLPATPGVEDVNGHPLESSARAKAYTVPGGWGESETERIAEHDVSPIDIDEEYHGNSPRLDVIEESEDDSDAFSDAAEDPSGFDGGFASLDAIVHSPISPVTKSKRVVPDSPTAKVAPRTAEEPTEEVSPRDWTQATAYWSSLSKQHKEQIEQQAAAREEAVVPVVEEPKAKKKKPKAAVVAPTEVASSPVPANRKPKAHVATQKTGETLTTSQPPSMRKSMRDSNQGVPVAATAEQPTQMRKSMRGTDSPRTSGAMRGSMRDGSGPSPRQRPVSMIQQGRAAPQQSPARPVSSGGRIAASAAARGPQPAPPAPSAYMKMPQDDSDSESSFKKKRRPSTSTIDSMGKVNMRRSMRAGSVDARPQSPTNAPGSSKWSIRSSSPPTNSRATMRQSLRRGSMDDVPTMRGKNSRAAARDSSASRFSVSSFRTSSKPSLAPPPPSQPKASGFRSRFNDSDDEGEAAAPARGRTFASRFADSDDEGDSPTVAQRAIQNEYTPVRGIPRRAGQDDDDSTDLDDSDDNAAARRRPANKRVSKAPVVPSQFDIDKVMEQARRNVAAQTGNSNIGMPEQTTPRKKVTLRAEPETDGPATNGQMSPAGSDLNKRRGLLGSIFGRKRTMSSSTLPQLQSGAATGPPPQMSQPASPATPTRGKLQRKGTGQLSRQSSSATALPTLANQQNQTVSTPVQNHQNWPLPPTIPDSEPKSARPKTSDGAVNMPRTLRDRAPRPVTNRRSYSNDAAVTKADDAVYSERTGKKKRFGKLRKAFGLND
ncbi:hypothetical protein MBLNU457_7733t1 [Dothideomycetes sp. NU457]